MRKITTAEALAAQIQDGATIAISGNGGGMVEADHIMAAIEARFLQTGHPRDLTLIHSLGIGDRDCKGTNRFAHAEMLKRIIAGHFTWSPKMQALVKNNTIEAYCFPGGVIQALLREIGAGRPGLFTHVGLGSFVDPRNGGGKSNECTTDDLVELIEIDGETKLRYRPFKVDYAILRGTYADPRGNVSLEEEAIDMDSYSMALAAHNSGGKVFVQVRDVLEAGAIEPRRVKLPGILVDGIVEHREQPQTYLGGYDLTISGQHRRLSSNDAIELVSHPVRRLIARRAARELVAGASTNFGFGIPGGIPGVALREGVPYQSLWLSVEQGVHNGMMLDDAFFGCISLREVVLPLRTDTLPTAQSFDYLVEPDKDAFVNALVPKVVRTVFYSIMLDTFTAEHGARMTAMHIASDNADQLSQELRIQYNKARQNVITSELIDIVGGAEALNG